VAGDAFGDHDLIGVDLIIDGVLGIGGRPGLPDRLAALVAAAAERSIPIVAVDLPSGVAADTGQAPSGSVRATRTVTFGAYKPCHLIEPAASRAGLIELVDIGLDLTGTPPALAAWQVADVVAHWPTPGSTSDKYARGVVGVDTGSDAYPGAGVLSTLGAVHGGAGMVRYLGSRRSAEIIGRELPNVVFAEGRVQCWLVGSGWGDRAGGDQVIARLIDSGLPLVIDADGLRHLPDRVPGSVLLTPHAGELARLLDCERGDVTSDPVSAVRAGADRTGATVLLKGATQLVATPATETVEVAVPGPAWTGQAGSGDVLGGLCAAVLAAGVGARAAAVLGASVQAMTAARFPGPVPPQELARHCATVIGDLGRTGRPE
jgi:NAD(P)H-hydrate repair Nnr-like enzyme with NAD(P)H-hydrate dehydratase domain